MECLQADSEQLSGTSLVLAGGRQSLQDQFALGGVDCRSDWKADPGEPGGGGCRGTAEVRREMLPCHGSAVRGDSGPLERVTQFANVSRPGIRFEEVHDVCAHAGNFLMMLRRYVGQQMLDEKRKIFLVLAHGRQMNVKNVQAEVEVLAQMAIGDS